MASKNGTKSKQSKSSKGLKKSNSNMSANRQQLMKQSKSSRNAASSSSPKSKYTVISSKGSSSTSSTPKAKTGLIFSNMNKQPLKRKRKNQNQSQSANRPIFQFKIGMQVGVALGDCFLQLQKLENSMDKLRNVSEDITDVMQCIEQMGGSSKLNRKRSMTHGSDNDHHGQDEDPVEEVHVLNDNLLKWQKDAAKRMKNVSMTVTKLQSKLEDLDEYHSQAQNEAILTQKQDLSQVSKAMEQIQTLQAEVQKAKSELSQKNIIMQKLKKSVSEPSNAEILKEKLMKLETKEKELDRDAEIIATQSEELRKESERLLTERDEVRKQKEQWQKMIDEVKEQKAKLEQRESELQANHKKLLELHETLSEEKKKLHKKAKKIKAREKRLNALRNAQTQSYQIQQNQYQIPSSNGSDYAESELTYFSDGDTEIASVNSISDDESNDNYHKQQLKAIAHLGVPSNPMF